MKTTSLELLERTQLSPAQARAILQVMESELAAHDSVLASKADLLGGLHGLELKLDDKVHGLELKLESQRAELISEIKGTVRWNFAFWVTQLAAMAAILKLLK
jgi:hypothetical protein